MLDEEDLWNFGGEDLEAAIMGIAFPRKDKSDRIKDLNNLILGRFENGGADEFYRWAKAIHGNVIESMPANVQTKVLAFTDYVATANDRITGQTSIIAFRATGSIKELSESWENITGMIDFLIHKKYRYRLYS